MKNNTPKNIIIGILVLVIILGGAWFLNKKNQAGDDRLLENTPVSTESDFKEISIDSFTTSEEHAQFVLNVKYHTIDNGPVTVKLTSLVNPTTDQGFPELFKGFHWNVITAPIENKEYEVYVGGDMAPIKFFKKSGEWDSQSSVDTFYKKEKNDNGLVYLKQNTGDGGTIGIVYLIPVPNQNYWFKFQFEAAYDDTSAEGQENSEHLIEAIQNFVNWLNIGTIQETSPGTVTFTENNSFLFQYPIDKDTPIVEVLNQNLDTYVISQRPFNDSEISFNRSAGKWFIKETNENGIQSVKEATGYPEVFKIKNGHAAYIIGGGDGPWSYSSALIESPAKNYLVKITVDETIEYDTEDGGTRVMHPVMLREDILNSFKFLEN